MKKMLEEFHQYRRSCGMSEDTLLQIKTNIKLFYDWLEEKNILVVTQLDRNVCREYIAYLYSREKFTAKGGKLEKATIRKHIDFIRDIGKFLIISDKKLFDISEGIKKPRAVIRRINAMSIPQARIVFALLPKVVKNPHTLSMQFKLYTVLIDTGLRIHEVLKLSRENINFETNMFKFIGKGDKERVVPFGDETRRLILNDSGYLFEGRTKGKPMSSANVRNILRRIKKAAGLDMNGIRLSPHVFRHTFARQWIVNDGDPFSLMQVMGHSDINTTMKYVYLGEQEIVNKHKKYAIRLN